MVAAEALDSNSQRSLEATAGTVSSIKFLYLPVNAGETTIFQSEQRPKYVLYNTVPPPIDGFAKKFSPACP
jgi:hypothetical protein